MEGISLDFLYLNIVGYVCYTTSICMIYFNTFVREEYAIKYTPLNEPGHSKHYPLLKINDVAYTMHGLACVMAVYYQVHFTNYKKTRAQQHLSRYTQALLWAVILVCSLMAGSLIFLREKAPLKLLDLAETLGFIKVCMSTSKYIPQLIYNQRRRSTKGWAMNSMALDIVGGLSSMSQLFLDGYLNGDIGAVWGNTSKLALAMVTMLFDMMFMFQHYVLFPSQTPEVISLSDFK